MIDRRFSSLYRALNPDCARRAAAERPEVEPLEIRGAHSPFLARPAELAAILGPILG